MGEKPELTRNQSCTFLFFRFQLPEPWSVIPNQLIRPWNLSVLNTAQRKKLTIDPLTTLYSRNSGSLK